MLTQSAMKLLCTVTELLYLQALPKRIQKEFHVGHPRMSWMKSLVRSYIYGTNMDRDVQNIVKAGKRCAFAAKAPPVKLSSWSKTNRM